MTDRIEAEAAVLTPEAHAFLEELHRTFEPRRAALLEARAERRARFAAGERPRFRPETEHIRSGEWQVEPPPPDLVKRWVEITGPTSRKLVINALNSGATGFMADFEDATTPTWENLLEGQINLSEAIAGTLEHRAPDGREYRVRDTDTVLLVRPRGWHLSERHLLVDGVPMAGALFDFGLYLFRNARQLLAKGTGPYLYLPKLEGAEEARLWNDVFVHTQDALGLPRGTIRATVLIETLPAAFEMEEILYELREHSAGLNAGRWDYIFSVIKCFREDPGFVLPDRAEVTMTVPFMRAYTRLLVATCHRRGAHAIGGMAAHIPNRADGEANDRALSAVRADKEREATDGFDGTWVAHPGLVALALETFGRVLEGRPNQVERGGGEVDVEPAALLDPAVPSGRVTEAGVRNNVSVAIRYLAAWLNGTGAVAIDGLMEDAATAEIARAQIWQWVRHGVSVDGSPLTRARVVAVAEEELASLRRELGEEAFDAGKLEAAWELFESLALEDELPEFLTLGAYELVA